MPRKPSAPKRTLARAVKAPKPKRGQPIPTAMTDSELALMRRDILCQLTTLVAQQRFGLPELAEFDIPDAMRSRLSKVDQQRIKAAYSGKPYTPKSPVVKVPAALRNQIKLYTEAVLQRPTARPDDQIALVSPEGNVILVAPVEAEVSRYIELGYVPERVG